jgi:hypothetical protein
MPRPAVSVKFKSCGTRQPPRVSWDYKRIKGWSAEELITLRRALIKLGSGKVQAIEMLFHTKTSIEVYRQIRNMFGQVSISGISLWCKYK